jgi:hypothetical protein
MKVYTVTDTKGTHFFWFKGYTSLEAMRNYFHLYISQTIDLFFLALEHGDSIYAHPSHYTVSIYELDGDDEPNEVYIRLNEDYISVDGKAYRTKVEASEGSKYLTGRINLIHSTGT